MSKKYHIWTSGCQMNAHDSERIAGIFSETGYRQADDSAKADVIVLNTCSIREKAEQKFYSELGRLKKVKNDNPHLKIAVAGCIAQQKGKTLFKRFPYVDFIFGPNNIDNLHNWIDGNNVHTALDDNPEYHRKLLPVKRAGQVRAWVSIMYGCNNFCSYCVVPYTRGRERSRSSDDVYQEISLLAQRGFKEVTMLGQNVNSYGKNLHDNMDFPDLIKKIHEINGIQRIRFVTSHPGDFSEKLIRVLKDFPKVCEHLHLPVQAGSDKILSLMNRSYTCEEYKDKINLLRNAIPDIAITSDIIVGFPGETDEDFESTVNLLSDIEFDGIFAFKYSKRPDTKALCLPDHVDEEIKSLRLTRVLQLQEFVTYQKNKTLEGKDVEILVEGVNDADPDKLTGRTRTNKIVNFYGDRKDIGSLIHIRILEAKQHSLSGEKVQGSFND